MHLSVVAMGLIDAVGRMFLKSGLVPQFHRGSCSLFRVALAEIEFLGRVSSCVGKVVESRRAQNRCILMHLCET